MGFQRVKKGIFRRGCVGLLAAAMSVGLLGTFAEAATVRDVAVLDISEPRVSIIGNGVVDKTKKATGFYELSLCVQTTFVYEKGTDGKADYHKEVTWAEYQEKLAKAEETDKANGTATEVAAVEAAHVVEEHPFSYAAAAVRVDMDALTAVSWDEAKPTYAEWGDIDGDGNKEYKANDGTYPRGIDESTLEETFDVTAAELDKINHTNNKQVRLDTAAPDEAVRATAMVEEYDEDTKTALITLTANTSYYKAVNYTEPTPVVVIRFAYDTKRFPNTVKKDGTTADFFVGLDKNKPDEAGQTVLTYLTDSAKGHTDFDKSAAASTAQQVVNASTYTESGGEETSFYYYLGADPTPATTAGTVNVYDKDGKPIQDNVAVDIPDTAGRKILAKTVDDSGNVSYSYLTNLLTMETTTRQTLVIEYVNQETYRKNTGGKGVQILFYDWDDTLLGSLVVDETGDARAEVEAYVEQNMVHPDLRTDVAKFSDAKTSPTTSWDSSVTEYAALRDSLRREYSYRGKYAYEYGKDGDPSYVVDNGEHYPLTNKLDYVFYKRINGVTHGVLTDGSTGEETKKDYYSTMNLSQFEDAAAYPYVYGWALVRADPLVETDKAKADGTKVIDGKARQDVAALEDTWTTIGTEGELENVEPKHKDKNQPIPTTSGTMTADPTKYPAWLDPAELGTATDPWTPPTTYQFTTSEKEGNAYFKFADFSKMEDLVGEGDNERDTIVVKAVYEEGEKLLTAHNYRMAKPPSYSKLNDLAASSGGAYTAKMTFERANYDDDGNICGVFRARSPVVRQQTTSDIRWEETEVDGKRQTLTNATTYESESAKTKTVYTYVAVENKDVMEAELVLSARQNKVNVYLMETTGFSFVNGGERTEGNLTRKDEITGLPNEDYVIDNYNYYADDSLEDEYYDAPYDEREGSHGFVLYGTLNYIMEQATEIVNTEEGSLAVAASAAVLNDANLRMNAAGDQPGAFNASTVQTRIIAAAQEIVNSHQGDPDFWNEDRNCAELTYHQLQYYLIYNTLLTREAADNEKFSWCHLHKVCADENSTLPKTWGDLIDAILTDPDNMAAKMQLADMKKILQLKETTYGTDFSSASDMVLAVKNALATLSGADQKDWVKLQAAIIGYTGDSPERDFWWVKYDTKPTTISGLSDLVTALEDKSTAVTLADGKTFYSEAKLKPMVDLITKNNAEADEDTWSGYVTATENLIASITTEDGQQKLNKFADYSEFVTAVEKAYQKVKNAGYASSGNLWYYLQWSILHPGDNITDCNPSTLKSEYYWHNGGKLITDLESMLQNAKEDSENWKSFTKEQYEALKLYFKSDFKGTTDAATNFDDFKTKVKAYADKYAGTDDASWEGLQYYLLHDGTYIKSGAIAEGKNYYWWRADESGNQGAGTPVSFGNAHRSYFIEAAFKSRINGNKKAWDGISDATIVEYLQSSLMRIIKTNTLDVTETKWANLPKYTESDVNGFKQAMEALVEEVVKQKLADDTSYDGHTPPDINWYQIQNWLAGNGYDKTLGTSTDKDEMAALDERMWWYKLDEKPVAEEPDTAKREDTFDTLFDEDDGIFNDYDQFDDNYGPDIYKILSSRGYGFTYEGKSLVDRTDSWYRIVYSNLDDFMSEYDDDGDGETLSWYQIQYGINEGEYASPEDARDMFYDDYIDSYGDNRPQWLKDEEAGVASLSAISIMEEEVDPQVEAMMALMAGMDEAQKQMVLDYINQLLNPTKPAEEVTTDAAEREETPDEVAPAEDAEESAAEDSPDRVESTPDEGDSSSNVVDTTPDEGGLGSNTVEPTPDTGGTDSGGGDRTTNSADGNSANDWMNDHLNFVEEIEEVPTVATAATIEPRKSGRFTQRIETAEATVTEVTVAWPLCDFNRTAKTLRRTRR